MLRVCAHACIWLMINYKQHVEELFISVLQDTEPSRQRDRRTGVLHVEDVKTRCCFLFERKKKTFTAQEVFKINLKGLDNYTQSAE